MRINYIDTLYTFLNLLTNCFSRDDHRQIKHTNFCSIINILKIQNKKEYFAKNKVKNVTYARIGK